MLYDVSATARHVIINIINIINIIDVNIDCDAAILHAVIHTSTAN